MNYNVDVQINDNNFFQRIDSATEMAVYSMTQQALADCNFYCKEDTETLIKSSLIHTDGAGGELRWVENYAENQYSYPGTRRSKNPNACPQWCEVAENNHKKEWEIIFANTLRRELNDI